MKKLILLFCLIAGIVQAETNYVYITDSQPLFIGTNCFYDVAKDSVTIGEYTLGGIDWTRIKVVQTTNTIPSPFTNIAQVTSVEILPGSSWKYSIKKTTEWDLFTTALDATAASIDLYAPLMSDLTNSISQVTDAKSKAALNDVKVLIKQLQDEIKLTHDEVKALKKVIGKNVMVCEP